ncbi:MAG: DNA-directed RNA polymerase subunit L [Sulfolobaceae archaeon]|nr:DNA-directed RNA polymerase subunit L [Sulfolobaceae archaeon]
MEIKVVKEDKNYLEIEIQGEEHTLGNLIAGLLRRVNGVTFVTYNKPHPLIDTIYIKILTDGTITPKEALLKAIQQGEELANRFINDVKNL